MRRGAAGRSVCWFALGLAGCATAVQPIGRDFSEAPFPGFRLDRTTIEEAEAALGPPMKLSTLRGLVGANSKTLAPGTPYSITKLNYYFLPNGVGAKTQAHPGKVATLLFLNGRLIGYGADSNIPGEANNAIDESRLASLQQCKTTRSEVIALLGQPNGEALHVLDAQAGAVEFAYSWSSMAAGQFEHKTLRVFFDPSGAMSNYTLTEDAVAANAGPTFPQPQPPIKLPPRCPSHSGREPT